MRITVPVGSLIVASAVLGWWAAPAVTAPFSADAFDPANWELSITGTGDVRVLQFIRQPGDAYPTPHLFTRNWGSEVWEVEAPTPETRFLLPLSDGNERLIWSSRAMSKGRVIVQADWIAAGEPPAEVLIELADVPQPRATKVQNIYSDEAAKNQARFERGYDEPRATTKVYRVSAGTGDAQLGLPIEEDFPFDSIPLSANPYLARIAKYTAGFTEFSKPNFYAATTDLGTIKTENTNPIPTEITLDVGAVANTGSSRGKAIMKYESPSIFPTNIGAWTRFRSYNLSHPAQNNFRFDDSMIKRTYTEAELIEMIKGKPDINVLTMEAYDGLSEVEVTGTLTLRVHAPYEFVSATPFRKVVGRWIEDSSYVSTPATISMSIGASGPEHFGKDIPGTEPKQRPASSWVFSDPSRHVYPRVGIGFAPSRTFPGEFIRAFLVAAGSPAPSAINRTPVSPKASYGPFFSRVENVDEQRMMGLQLRPVYYEREIVVREFGPNGYVGLRTLIERCAAQDIEPGGEVRNYEARAVVYFSQEPLRSLPNLCLYYVNADGTYEVPDEEETPE